MRVRSWWIMGIVVVLSGCSEVLGFDAYLSGSSAGGNAGASGAGATAAGGSGAGGAGTAGASAGGSSTAGATTGGSSGMGGGGTAGASTGGGATCGQGSCVPAAPDGWTYARAHSIPAGGFPPAACPGGGAPSTYFSEPNLTSCKKCLCTWSSVKCSEPELTCYFDDSACASAPAFSITPTGSSCVPAADIPQNPGAVGSCEITKAPQPLSAGSCMGHSDQILPLPFATEVTLCDVAVSASSDCPGELCAGPGNADFNAAPCLLKAGDVPCPAGSGSRQIIYTGGADGRTCSTCQCGAPTTTCNSANYLVYNDDLCGGTAVSVDPAGCKSVGDALSGAARSLKPPIIAGLTTSSCTGGVADGEVTPEGPTTLCCP